MQHIGGQIMQPEQSRVRIPGGGAMALALSGMALATGDSEAALFGEIPAAGAVPLT
jgi:hypothetical protein